jgi:ABC-type multidrug transport system fused ATPase/permease subunit
MGWGEWRTLLNTYLRPQRRLVAVLGAFLFLSIGLQVATPQLVRVFIDRAITPDGGPIGLLTIAYVLAVLVQQTTAIITAWLSEQVGWITTNELRVDLMEHCLDLDPAFHEAHPPGELIERVDGDLNGLSAFFAQFLLTVLGSLLLLVGVIVVAWLQNATAGVVLTGFAIVGLITVVLVRRVAANAWERQRESSAVLFGFLEERLAGTEDIRACAAEAHTLRGFYDRARDRLWRTSHARVMDAIPWSANGVVFTLAHTVSFVVPAVLVGRGSMTVGGAFVIYFYTQLLMQPLVNMSHQVEALQLAIAGGRRVLALLAMEPELVDGPGAPLPSGALPVSFANVSFGYGTDPDVLHDVTVDLQAGEVLGIVGRTGSGKSSIAKLLVRFYDVRAGGVSVGGVDVRQLTRGDLRSRVALVTQDVHVLRASVRDNLTLFDPDVPDERIVDAVGRLGLGDWFAALPDGLDTVVREGGAGMSAGESQLLSFGRAFLRDPSVVVLDEASSRLDPATEDVLESAVDALLDGRTGIVIAHRLATLERCDRICVLDHGRVVELGDRAALAADPSSRFGLLLRAGLDVVGS